jgi:GMP synthase-like glutamine amidotransferase
MNVHVLQHVSFEDIGSMEPWLLARGATIGHTRFFEAWSLPDPAGLDLVIAMGGPMSVNDEAELPWLIDEKRFLRQALDLGLPVLGVCLGAQLMANALGAPVRRGAQREIGWFDIAAVAGTPPGTFTFPEAATVFHWHGETFGLPAGAVHLARSVACENQAFQWGPRAIGLQFHLETTPESAAALVAHCRDELTGGPFVQTETELLAAPAAAYERIHGLMGEVLGFLLRDSG